MPMPSGNENSGWLGWLVVAQTITWIVAIGGWIWNDRTSKWRENRKDVRTRLDVLRDSIDKLREVALDYYGTERSEATKRKEIEIKALQARLQVDARSLAVRLETNIDELILAMMDAVTGGDFESASRKKIDFDDPFMATICASTEALLMAIESKYYQTDR